MAAALAATPAAVLAATALAAHAQDSEEMPGRDLTAPPPATPRGTGPGPAKAPFQPRSSFAIRIVVPDGELAGAPAGASRGARAACEALYASRGGRCRGAGRVEVKEYHVLRSQPLTLAAYVDERDLARMAGIREGRADPEPAFRLATCDDDQRFEDGERISDTLVSKSGARCPEGAADGSPAARYGAVARIVEAERRDGDDGGGDPVDPEGAKDGRPDAPSAPDASPQGRFVPRSMGDPPMP